MSKKVGKAVIGLACIGAVAGAVIAYLNTAKHDPKSLNKDFDDFSDEFEKPERSYTTIPKDAAADLGDTVKEKAEDMTDAVKETVKE